LFAQDKDKDEDEDERWWPMMDAGTSTAITTAINAITATTAHILLCDGKYAPWHPMHRPSRPHAWRRAVQL